MKLGKREMATILAALRHWQTVDQDTRKYAEQFLDIEPLTDEEIDELCFDLNFSKIT
jgi:c-di-GMP-binding flagellar brake protein YcgR